MLIFDNCPTCFQDFTAAAEHAPHTISCGHVFCYKCLMEQDPKFCALCRDPFVLREVRRIFPSVDLDDAADAARIDQEVVRAIDGCHPETFERAIGMLQGWLAKGTSTHASFQGTVLRMETYKKTMSRLAKAYGDMCEYEAVVRSMEDRTKEFTEQSRKLEAALEAERQRVSRRDQEVHRLLGEVQKGSEGIAEWQAKFDKTLTEMKVLELELLSCDNFAQRCKEEAHNHETDALRWRARYEQAISDLARVQNLSSRASSVSGETFTTGYVY